MRRTASLLISTVLLSLAAACGAPRGRGAGDARARLAEIRAGQAEVAAAREALDRARAGGESVDPGALRLIEAAYEAAYSKQQRSLAAFLNAALNERPDAPETLEALGIYTAAAVRNARFFLDEARDGGRALEVLEPAARCYRALGLPLPSPLAGTLAEAGRFLASPPTPAPAARGGRPRP